jgi:hypothetical protein
MILQQRGFLHPYVCCGLTCRYPYLKACSYLTNNPFFLVWYKSASTIFAIDICINVFYPIDIIASLAYYIRSGLFLGYMYLSLETDDCPGGQGPILIGKQDPRFLHSWPWRCRPSPDIVNKLLYDRVRRIAGRCDLHMHGEFDYARGIWPWLSLMWSTPIGVLIAIPKIARVLKRLWNEY